MTLPTNRAEAKLQGLTRYFTGKPCKHGHVAERIASSGACVLCKRCLADTWRSDNPEKSNAAHRAWADRNREKVIASRLTYTSNNAERLTEMKRAWRQRNPEKIKAKNEKWIMNNNGRTRQLNADWYRKNPDKVAARDMKRRAGVQQAAVDWDTELTSFTVKEATDLAKLREAVTGFKWQIDHMIPIQCRSASGFHVWSNLQLIPARLNIKKLNRLIFTVPGEWIMKS